MGVYSPNKMVYNGSEMREKGGGFMADERLCDLIVPEDCAVRLIDLDVRVPGLTSVDETGFANIYINARLSRDAQRAALAHELRHHRRGDVFSRADIRDVERDADRPDAPVLLALDGTPLPAPPPGFDPALLRPTGRGLYRPEGAALERSDADVRSAGALLIEACGVYDVLQTPPLVPCARLAALAGGLCAEDIAFLAFPPPAAGTRLSAALQLYREDGGRLHGAIFYDARGRADNALIRLEPASSPVRVTIDLRARQGRLCLRAVSRETEGGGYEIIYG